MKILKYSNDLTERMFEARFLAYFKQDILNDNIQRFADWIALFPLLYS